MSELVVETSKRTVEERKRDEWERPRIVSRERLEVVAAVCSPGKGPAEPGDCFLNANS